MQFMRGRQRAWAAVALALVLSGAAGGCRRAAAPAGAEASGAAAGVELVFWHIQNTSPTREVIAAAVARFTAANPGVKVRVVLFQNDDFKTKLKTAIAGADAPDVFHTWGGGVLKEYYDAGLVRDLSGLYADPAFTARFPPAALSAATVDGRPLLVPADLSVVLFFYNRRLFAANQLEPPPTMAAFVDLCAKLRARGLVPVALGNKDKWPGCFYYVYGVLRAEGGRDAAVRAARLEPEAFAHASFRRGGDVVRELAQADCFNPGFQGIDFPAARRLLFTGQAAMTLMGTWLIANASAEAPDLVKDLGCFPFPGDGGVVGGTNCAFAVSAKCRHPAQAEELLKYLADAELARAWARTGRLPAGQGAQPEDFTPLTQQAADLLARAPFTQLYFDQLFPPALGEKHKETCQALFSGELTPAAAATALAETAAGLRPK